MSRTKAKTIIGKWRIIAMELWGSDYLDMVEPAYIRFQRKGSGEFKFGCVAAGLDCDWADTDVEFTWRGFDEMDEASGSGWAELNEDGTLSGEIKFHLGDESTFKARRW